MLQWQNMRRMGCFFRHPEYHMCHKSKGKKLISVFNGDIKAEWALCRSKLSEDKGKRMDPENFIRKIVIQY